MRVTDSATSLPSDSFAPVVWPNQEGGEIVYGHLVCTKVKKLGACQVLIVKPTLDAPRSQCRYWVTSRIKDTLDQVVAAAATRWTIESLFADLKE